MNQAFIFKCAHLGYQDQAFKINDNRNVVNWTRHSTNKGSLENTPTVSLK